ERESRLRGAFPQSESRGCQPRASEGWRRAHDRRRGREGAKESCPRGAGGSPVLRRDGTEEALGGVGSNWAAALERRAATENSRGRVALTVFRAGRSQVTCPEF